MNCSISPGHWLLLLYIHAGIAAPWCRRDGARSRRSARRIERQALHRDGQSQSAARLATYVNAMHPVTNFFSGFMFCALVGGGSELSNPEIIPGELAADRTIAVSSSMIVPCVIHDDLDTPILILLSESEARNFGVPPQPDSKWIRVWRSRRVGAWSGCWWRLLSRLAYQRTRAEAGMPSPPSG